MAGTAKATESPEAENPAPIATAAVRRQQLIVWTGSDREVALKTVFMDAENCRKLQWTDTVGLLAWRPSGKPLAEDAQLPATGGRTEGGRR